MPERKKQRRGGTGKPWSFRLIDDQNLAEATRYSLSAAKYHLEGMRHFMEDLIDTPFTGVHDPDAKKAFNKFYHHLRAFFWELCASFDTLLQEINRRLELEIPERDVDWDMVSEALSKSPKYKKLSRKLNLGFSSKWFTEVREYRNFAHRGTVLVEAWGVGSESKPGKGVRLAGLMLRPVSGGRGAGEPINLCRDYGQRVSALVRWGLDELDHIRPTEHTAQV